MTSPWLTIQCICAKHSTLFRWNSRAWKCCQTHCYQRELRRGALLIFSNSNPTEDSIVEKWKSRRRWIAWFFLFFDLALRTHCPSTHQISPDQIKPLNKEIFRSLDHTYSNWPCLKKKKNRKGSERETRGQGQPLQAPHQPSEQCRYGRGLVSDQSRQPLADGLARRPLKIEKMSLISGTSTPSWKQDLRQKNLQPQRERNPCVCIQPHPAASISNQVKQHNPDKEATHAKSSLKWSSIFLVTGMNYK